MKTKLLKFLALGLGLVAVAISCSRPSSGPANTPARTESLAVKQASVPTWLFGPPVDATTKITAANMTAAQPQIPSDLYRTNNQVDHGQAAIFAWLEFIALAAPTAKPPMRGVPGAAFSSVLGGTNSTYPLVFETYQHRSELFPFNAVAAASPNASPTPGVTRPQPWDSTPKYVYDPQPTPAPGADYTLFNNLDEASQIFQNHLFFPNANDPKNPFQVLFEAKVNQLEWQYVTNTCQTDASNNCQLTLSQSLILPNGTMEIKVAWRPVTSIETSQLSRYHIAKVITYTGDTNGNPVAHNDDYALIGLHIIHKTANYPSFIFATFEQVDQFTNQVTKQPSGVEFLTLYPAPDPGQSPTPLPTPTPYQSGSYYFAVDPGGYSAQPSPSPGTFAATTNPTRVFDVNNPFAWPNGTQTSFTPVPNVSTNGKLLPVVLPPTSTTAVENVNQQVSALITQLINQGTLPKDFVWQYYKLTGVQAIPTSDETTDDYYLANIVVESSQAGIQLFRGGLSQNPSFEPVPNVRNKINVNDTASNQKYSMGGCMGCHGAAQGEGGDFSFLVSTGQGGFNVDTIVGTDLTLAIKNATARRAFIHRNPKFVY